MGRIKKVLWPSRDRGRVASPKRLRRGDIYDQEFWREFLREDKLRSVDQMGAGSEKDRVVTITIRDEETGEEWVIERVQLRTEMKGV